MTVDSQKYSETQEAIKNNDPPIVPGQLWGSRHDDGKLIRGFRPLAKHPAKKNCWICENVNGSLKTGHMNGELLLCPEFNLRFVFQLLEDTRYEE